MKLEAVELEIDGCQVLAGWIRFKDHQRAIGPGCPGKERGENAFVGADLVDGLAFQRPRQALQKALLLVQLARQEAESPFPLQSGHKSRTHRVNQLIGQGAEARCYGVLQGEEETDIRVHNFSFVRLLHGSSAGLKRLIRRQKEGQY